MKYFLLLVQLMAVVFLVLDLFEVYQRKYIPVIAYSMIFLGLLYVAIVKRKSK